METVEQLFRNHTSVSKFYTWHLFKHDTCQRLNHWELYHLIYSFCQAFPCKRRNRCKLFCNTPRSCHAYTSVLITMETIMIMTRAPSMTSAMLSFTRRDYYNINQGPEELASLRLSPRTLQPVSSAIKHYSRLLLTSLLTLGPNSPHPTADCLACSKAAPLLVHGTLGMAKASSVS